MGNLCSRRNYERTVVVVGCRRWTTFLLLLLLYCLAFFHCLDPVVSTPSSSSSSLFSAAQPYNNNRGWYPPPQQEQQQEQQEQYNKDEYGLADDDDDNEEGDDDDGSLNPQEWEMGGPPLIKESGAFPDGEYSYYSTNPPPRGPPRPKMPPPPPPSKQHQQQQQPLPIPEFKKNYAPIDYSFPSKEIVDSSKGNNNVWKNIKDKGNNNNNDNKRSVFWGGWRKDDKKERDFGEKKGLGKSFPSTKQTVNQNQDDGWFDISLGDDDTRQQQQQQQQQQKQQPDYDEVWPAGVPAWADPSVQSLQQQRRRRGVEEEEKRDYVSARRDPVARYMAHSLNHRVNVYFWATCLGCSMGGYLGQSLFSGHNGALVVAITLVGLLFGLLAAWARNPYGDWTRAAALACWWTLQQSKQIRRQYPTGRHLRALLGIGPRRPFPPIIITDNGDNSPPENPWTYNSRLRRRRPPPPPPRQPQPQGRNGNNSNSNNGIRRGGNPYGDDEEDVDFEMWSALACMVLVGSFAGGTIPVIPSWMGALGGGASLALLTTRLDARGDLCRTAGMRVRQMAGVAWQVVMEDLQLPTLTGEVTRRILNRILILDRQHKLQDKLMSASSWAFGLIQNMVRQARGESVSGGSSMTEKEKEDDSRYYQDRNRRSPPKGPAPLGGNNNNNNNDRRQGRGPLPRDDRRRPNDQRGRGPLPPQRPPTMPRRDDQDKWRTAPDDSNNGDNRNRRPPPPPPIHDNRDDGPRVGRPPPRRGETKPTMNERMNE